MNENINNDIGQTIASLVDFERSYSDEVLFSHNDLVPIQKANFDKFAGNNINSISKTDDSLTQILEPTFDFIRLKEIYDISDSLKTCIEAYSTNISGFGFELVPVIDLIEENGKKVYRKDKIQVDNNVIESMENEESRLEMFFNSLSLDNTWIQLQCLKREMLEIYGNAYYEYESDLDNNIVGVTILEVENIRLTKRETEPFLINQKVKNPKTLEYIDVPRYKRFRKFVQVIGVKKNIYFKEFGDPRVMNALDGEFLKDNNGNYLTKYDESIVKALNKPFKIATEVYHYKLIDTSNIDGYGVPRWVSLTPILLGVRSSDLINLNLLKNKGIPDLILICEGSKAGTLKKQIEDQLSQNKELGKQGSLLVVEGEQGATPGAGTEKKYFNPSIRVQPLSELLTKEGMFMSFSSKCNERVTSLYRLPNLLVGKTTDTNRSTAEVSKEIAQEQVFNPAQEADDSIINNLIFPKLGIKYFKYKSKSSQMKNTELTANIADKFIKNGSLMPGDGRNIVSDLLNKKFEDINEEYMNKPRDIYIKENLQNVENKQDNIQDNSINTNDIIVNTNQDNQESKLIQLEKSDHSALYNVIEKSLKDIGINTKNAYLYIQAS